MHKNIIDTYIKKGFSLFNTGTHEKKIKIPWTKFQTEKPTLSDMKAFHSWSTQNWAIVTGEISNLIVFDIDTKNGADPTPFQNLGMYEVRTPSGGYHFYCLYDPLLKSTKHKRNPQSGILKGVDIQSNGAIVFCPPTTFENGTYTVVHDVPLAPIPDQLLAGVLEALEPEKEATEYTPYKPQQFHLDGNARTGDVYNALATWADVLLPLGWTPVPFLKQGGTQYWRRPGKRDGISASTNYKDYDLMFTYSTSTDLLTHKGYTKFNALATLQYNGNYKETAKALILNNINLAKRNIING